jgi:predicted RNase H-like nuclease (RuvC/YqgF family)
MNSIQEQYGQYGQMSGAEVNYGGNASPVGSKTSSDSVSDNDQIKKLQQQVNMLQREIRKLHNRHREMHSELQRLRQRD